MSQKWKRAEYSKILLIMNNIIPVLPKFGGCNLYYISKTTEIILLK